MVWAQIPNTFGWAKATIVKDLIVGHQVDFGKGPVFVLTTIPDKSKFKVGDRVHKLNDWDRLSGIVGGMQKEIVDELQWTISVTWKKTKAHVRLNTEYIRENELAIQPWPDPKFLIGNKVDCQISGVTTRASEVLLYTAFNNGYHLDVKFQNGIIVNVPENKCWWGMDPAWAVKNMPAQGRDEQRYIDNEDPQGGWDDDGGSLVAPIGGFTAVTSCFWWRRPNINSYTEIELTNEPMDMLRDTSLMESNVNYEFQSMESELTEEQALLRESEQAVQMEENTETILRALRTYYDVERGAVQVGSEINLYADAGESMEAAPLLGEEVLTTEATGAIAAGFSVNPVMGVIIGVAVLTAVAIIMKVGKDLAKRERNKTLGAWKKPWWNRKVWGKVFDPWRGTRDPYVEKWWPGLCNQVNFVEPDNLDNNDIGFHVTLAFNNDIKVDYVISNKLKIVLARELQNGEPQYSRPFKFMYDLETSQGVPQLLRSFDFWDNKCAQNTTDEMFRDRFDSRSDSKLKRDSAYVLAHQPEEAHDRPLFSIAQYVLFEGEKFEVEDMNWIEGWYYLVNGSWWPEERIQHYDDWTEVPVPKAQIAHVVGWELEISEERLTTPWILHHWSENMQLGIDESRQKVLVWVNVESEESIKRRLQDLSDVFGLSIPHLDSFHVDERDSCWRILFDYITHEKVDATMDVIFNTLMILGGVWLAPQMVLFAATKIVDLAHDGLTWGFVIAIWEWWIFPIMYFDEDVMQAQFTEESKVKAMLAGYTQIQKSKMASYNYQSALTIESIQADNPFMSWIEAVDELAMTKMSDSAIRKMYTEAQEAGDMIQTIVSNIDEVSKVVGAGIHQRVLMWLGGIKNITVPDLWVWQKSWKRVEAQLLLVGGATSITAIVNNRKIIRLWIYIFGEWISQELPTYFSTSTSQAVGVYERENPLLFKAGEISSEAETYMENCRNYLDMAIETLAKFPDTDGSRNITSILVTGAEVTTGIPMSVPDTGGGAIILVLGLMGAFLYSN